MKNNSTNIKELIKRLQNGERLSPEEMRTVANHVAQLKFEKEQRAKRAQAVANEGEKKGLSFHEQVAKAEADAKKNRLRNNLEKNSSNRINSEEAALSNKGRIISELFTSRLLKRKQKLQSAINQSEKELKKKRNSLSKNRKSRHVVKIEALALNTILGTLFNLSSVYLLDQTHTIHLELESTSW